MELQSLASMSKKHLILTIVILLLVLGNVFFAVKYFLQIQESQKMQEQLTQQQSNKKVINFLNLFIKKVLKSDKEISFEDRLELENAIRDINDPELLAKWEQFTGGNNETQIQEGVKALLESLANKIYF